MSSKVKSKDLGRKPKILWVNEASFLRTGFSTIGWQVLRRLQATGKYDIVELGSYATQDDPRWKDPKWGINWKYYGVLPDQNDEQAKQEYQNGYHFNQFGKWKFDEVLLKEKPDIVIDIRDRWMASEWQLKSTYRKYFTYIYMPCFPAGEMVSTKSGYRPIETIKVGDEVLTHKGRYRKVTEVFKRPYNGELVVVKPSHYPEKIRMTPNHPVFASKRKHSDISRHNNSNWISAGELEKLDIVNFPTQWDFEDKTHFDFTGDGYDVELTCDVLQTLGFYIAEGCVNSRYKKKAQQLKFTFNISELHYAKLVANTFMEYFRVNKSAVSIFEKPENNKIDVVISNARLAQGFEALFGQNSANKRIPSTLYNLDRNKSLYLLAGILRGDGCWNPETIRGGYSTKSRQLGLQVWSMMLNHGCLCSSHFREYEQDGVHKSGYWLNSKSETFSRIYNLMKGGPLSDRIYKDDDQWYNARLTIKSIEREEYDGYVYNFEVEEDHSYVVGMSVHNCVDSHPPMPDWIKDYQDSDYILAYSHYAKHVLEIEGVKCHGVANPGVDTSIFYPKNKQETRARWNLRRTIKPILCVHRNQKRKLLPDMIYSYLLLKNENPETFKDTVLWFHTSWPDVGFNIPIVMDRAKQGRMPYKDARGKLKEKRFKKGLRYADVIFSYICHACGHTFVSPYVNGPSAIRDLETGEQKQDNLQCDLIYCQKCGKKEARMPNTQLGFDPEDFADVYNAAYVHVQPAIAGADEMPMNEAKACGTPVIAPVHAAMHEKVEKTNFCPDDRWKGGMPINLDALYTEAETMQHRCIFSKEHLAKQLNKILSDEALHSRLSKEAAQVVRDYYDWDDIAQVWDDLISNEVLVNTDDDKGWHSPPQLKEYDEYTVPSNEEMDIPTFIKWCYKHFLFIDKPDEPGLKYWIEDIQRGRERDNVVDYFKQQADDHNKREMIRSGKADPATATDNNTKKITDYMDPEDKFRILMVLPGTAGDLHLLTGTIKSLFDKYNREDPWGIYVACEDKYHDILKDIPFIKGLMPYSANIDNAKALEQSKVCNIAYTPHIITQLREHYVHRGHGRHLGRAYADACGVDFSSPVISPVRVDGLPNDYYVLHCKTSMKSKDWPIERFHSLARLFPDIQFLQVGGPNDPCVNEPNVLDFRGKTTFRQMAYVIKKAEGIIGLDSIALHIASTVGTKSLGIFAATYQNICGPLNSHGGGFAVPKNRPNECPEPCHMIKCPSKDHPCIHYVTVRQVAAAMEQIFND